VTIDGVGLLKIGTNLINVEEFYVVILENDLHPQKFHNYAEALRFFEMAKRFMGRNIRGQVA
jgi:hypothetical protein